MHALEHAPKTRRAVRRREEKGSRKERGSCSFIHRRWAPIQVHEDALFEPSCWICVTFETTDHAGRRRGTEAVEERRAMT